jgi:hypothetical protein
VKRGCTVLVTCALTLNACGGAEHSSPTAPQMPAEGHSSTGATTYPEPDPEELTKRVSGDAVPEAWVGTWSDEASGAEWHLFPAESPECAAITGGKTTCFANGPAGSAATDPAGLYSAAAITIADGELVLRMTFTPTSGGVSCFDGDAYRYSAGADTRLTLLLDNRAHCFYESAEATAAAAAGKIPHGSFTVWTRSG